MLCDVEVDPVESRTAGARVAKIFVTTRRTDIAGAVAFLLCSNLRSSGGGGQRDAPAGIDARPKDPDVIMPAMFLSDRKPPRLEECDTEPCSPDHRGQIITMNATRAERMRS